MQVIQDFGVNGAFPSTVGGTGTTVKYFGRNTANAAGATWVAAPATPSSTSPVGALWVPGDNRLNGQRFYVNACGSVLEASGASSEVVTIALYGVTGTLAAPVYTALATANYIDPIPGVAVNFSIRAALIATTDSGVVGGTQQIILNNTVSQAEAALANSLSSINMGSGNSSLYQGSPFGLVVGITFALSFAGNSAKLNEFNIEA